MVIERLWKDQLSHAKHSLLNQCWQILHKFPQRNLELLKIKIASVSRHQVNHNLEGLDSRVASQVSAVGHMTMEAVVLPAVT